MKKLGFFILLINFFTLTLFSLSHAQIEPDEKEIEIRKKAKYRTYPGGREEESIKVQTQLIVPLRKNFTDIILGQRAGAETNLDSSHSAEPVEHD
jgi:hypothetical protein